MNKEVLTFPVLISGALLLGFSSLALATNMGPPRPPDPPKERFFTVDESVSKLYEEEHDPVRIDQVDKARFTPGVEHSYFFGTTNGDLDKRTLESIGMDKPINMPTEFLIGKTKDEGDFELIVPNATPSFVFLPETLYNHETITTRTLVPDSEETTPDGSMTLVKAKTERMRKVELVGAGLNNATRIDINGVHFRDINYITPTGLNAGNQKVVNVEDGLIAHGSKDAINGGQLYDELQKLKAGNVNWNRINRMGAMAAALAGLHPMEYDERHRFSVSAAYGNYKNGHGLAAGLYYRPDHRSMVSAGLAISPGGDKMLNLGASYRIGAQKNEYASTFKDFASSEVAHQITINLRHVKEELDDHKADVKARFVAQRALDDKQTRRLQAQAREIRELKAQLAKEVQAFASYREKMASETQALEARLAQVEALLKK